MFGLRGRGVVRCTGRTAILYLCDFSGVTCLSQLPGRWPYSTGNASQMKRTPGPQCLKDRAEGLAVRSNLILYLKRGLLPHGSGHQTIRFEFAQLLPQNLDRDSRHRPPKFAKAERAFTKAAKDHRFPSALNHADRCVKGTLIALDVTAGFPHRKPPSVQGTSKCPIVKGSEPFYTPPYGIRPLVPRNRSSIQH